MRVSLSSYGGYTGNYGAHCMRVTIGSLTLYFSYQTVVAFEDNMGLKVTENLWGPTTGKHLNAIDGGNKAARLPSAKFTEELEKVLVAHNLEV